MGEYINGTATIRRLYRNELAVGMKVIVNGRRPCWKENGIYEITHAPSKTEANGVNTYAQGWGRDKGLGNPQCSCDTTGWDPNYPDPNPPTHLYLIDCPENDMFRTTYSNLSSSLPLSNESLTTAYNILNAGFQTQYTKMSRPIIEFIKNIGVSKEDRLMVEAGMENPVGVPTSEGYDAMEHLLYAENRAKLVKIVSDRKAEEDKEKK